MQGDPEDADTPVRMLDHGQDVGLGAVEQVDGEESRARIASAWECRNWDQAGLVRRRAGSRPVALRISCTVEAGTFTPSPASSPWILRYPQSGFLRASRRTSIRMLRRVAGRPALPRMDRVAWRRTMFRCQRTIVSGVTSSRSPGAALWVSRRAGPRAAPGPPSSGLACAAAVSAGPRADGAGSGSPLSSMSHRAGTAATTRLAG